MWKYPWLTIFAPLHFIPYCTQPSQIVDLILRQRKQFLDMPKGQVIPEATADNLAANSLKKEIFPMKIDHLPLH